MPLVVILHLYVAVIGLWSVSLGYRILFHGRLELVRDHERKPMLGAARVAKPYALNAICTGCALLLLCAASPLGLAFAIWMGSVVVVFIATSIISAILIARGAAS